MVGTSKPGVVFLVVAALIVTGGAWKAARAGAAAPAAAATQPVGEKTPDEVFKEKGLTRMGFWLVLPSEEQIHQAIPSVRMAKARIAADARVAKNAEAATKRSIAAFESTELALAQTDQDIAQSAQVGKRLNRNNSRYNEWVASYDELRAKRDSIVLSLQKQAVDLAELAQRKPAARDSRSAYVNLATDLGAKADAAVATYAALQKDAELQAAIQKANQTARPALRLGPSGVFAADLPIVRQYAAEVVSSSVPVVVGDNGIPTVQAVLNGKVTDTMLWDSGATAVSLSAATAASAGLTPTASDPQIDMTVADGRKVKATVMVLESVRVGSFTVKNVPCIVLPPQAKNADDLLGDTFQQNFVCKMDQQGGKLDLTPIDPDVAQSASPAVARGGKPAADSKAGPSGDSKTDAAGGNLLSTMQGYTNRVDDGAIVLEGDERISTAQKFKPPIHLRVVAQTDSTDLHLGYAANQIVFSWKPDPNQLRINGGPVGGRHTNGVGRIPANTWVTVELIVRPDSMKILVDGKERFSAEADFSGVNQSLSIFPGNGSTLKVKSVTAEVPKD